MQNRLYRTSSPKLKSKCNEIVSLLHFIPIIRFNSIVQSTPRLDEAPVRGLVRQADRALRIVAELDVDLRDYKNFANADATCPTKPFLCTYVMPLVRSPGGLLQ